MKYSRVSVGCLEYFCIILWILVTSYGANLQKDFGRDDDHKWPTYLKTHDYHRLLQHILPVAIIGLASAEVQDALWSLGYLLRWGMLKGIICRGDSKNEGNSSRGGM